jgi:hypothetical protein
LAIFVGSEDERKPIIQVHSSFLDGWDYTEQVKYLNTVARNFDIDKGYFDNTRTELEDRSLDSIWTPIPFTSKQKRRLAQVFEEYVINGKIELIQDQRQRSQITCVDNDLNAPQTPLGHGDAFWSVALAVLAHYDFTSKGTKDIGSLSDWVKAGDYASSKANQLDFDKNVEKGLCPKCLESAGWIKDRALCLICYSANLLEADLSGSPTILPG